VAATRPDTRVLGIAALKGAAFLKDDVSRLLAGRLTMADAWDVLLDYHHGGFAKTTPDLLTFMQRMQSGHSLPLDPVYTAKALYAIHDLLHRGYFSAGQRIVMIHPGGLQGARRVT